MSIEVHFMEKRSLNGYEGQETEEVQEDSTVKTVSKRRKVHSELGYRLIDLT